jgi:hypothetical protein
MESSLLFLIIFLASFLCIFTTKTINKKNELRAQFVVTGTLLLIFYAVCFFSGVCTILNFIFNWVL